MIKLQKNVPAVVGAFFVASAWKEKLKFRTHFFNF
jgi:hypothetical protein